MKVNVTDSKGDKMTECFISLCSTSGVRKRRQRNYSPLPWNNFFDKSEDVTTSGNNISFRSVPVVFTVVYIQPCDVHLDLPSC